jgi:hypothetical protein
LYRIELGQELGKAAERAIGLQGDTSSKDVPIGRVERWCDNTPMRTVGSRTTAGGTLADQRALVRTASALRGTPWLVPRGVYRFASFDEAETWMSETMRRTHAHLSRKTSSASVAP